MFLNIRSRIAGAIALSFLVSVAAAAADLGAKVAYKKDTPIQFTTFTVTYVGERRVVPKQYPNGFLYYDFHVASAQGKQTVSWSSGTGDIGPVLFQVGGEKYALELQRADKLGKLKENELVVSRVP